jgi:hypothetical protein
MKSEPDQSLSKVPKEDIAGNPPPTTQDLRNKETMHASVFTEPCMCMSQYVAPRKESAIKRKFAPRSLSSRLQNKNPSTQASM